MLAEISAKDISEVSAPKTMDEHADVARRGGSVALDARIRLEEETGKSVISPLNAKSIKNIEKGKRKP